MSVRIKEQCGGMLTLEVSFDLNGSMLDLENHIQDELNKAGCVATCEALKQFDTDGSSIVLSQTKLTARKQKASQHYECPYGSFSLERFLYQSNEGGYTYCRNCLFSPFSLPIFTYCLSYFDSALANC